MNTRIMAVALAWPRWTRIAQSICALAIVGLLPNAAAADFLGRLPTGPDYEGKILVVTGQASSTGTVCDVESDLYEVVITSGSSDGGPAIRTILAVPSGTAALNPGDRFDLTGQAPCGGGTHQVLQVSGPLMGDSEAAVSESVYITSELSYHERLLVVPTEEAGGNNEVNDGDVYEQRAILLDLDDANGVQLTIPHDDARASEERNEEAVGPASTFISPTSSGDRELSVVSDQLSVAVGLRAPPAADRPAETPAATSRES